MNTDLFWAMIRPGDVINTWPRKMPAWWNPSGWVERAIQSYQKKKWGKDSDYRPTHSQLYLGGGEIAECTLPVVRFTMLKLSDKDGYSIHRYTALSFTGFQQSDIDLMREAAKKLEGTWYDIPQLISIGIKGILRAMLGNLYATFKIEQRPLFDLGRKNKVCSVFVAFCLRYWWKNIGRPENMRTPIEIEEPPKEWPRPLGEENLETIDPAAFPNHETFTKIAEF